MWQCASGVTVVLDKLNGTARVISVKLYSKTYRDELCMVVYVLTTSNVAIESMCNVVNCVLELGQQKLSEFPDGKCVTEGRYWKIETIKMPRSNGWLRGGRPLCGPTGGYFAPPSFQRSSKAGRGGRRSTRHFSHRFE